MLSDSKVATARIKTGSTAGTLKKDLEGSVMLIMLLTPAPTDGKHRLDVQNL
jgi:hypothetical protein